MRLNIFSYLILSLRSYSACLVVARLFSLKNPLVTSKLLSFYASPRGGVSGCLGAESWAERLLVPFRTPFWNSFCPPPPPSAPIQMVLFTCKMQSFLDMFVHPFHHIFSSPHLLSIHSRLLSSILCLTTSRIYLCTRPHPFFGSQGPEIVPR